MYKPEDQEVSKQKDTQPEPEPERVLKCQPVVINDPNCKHEWVYAFEDSEGFVNERCTKCPFGRRVFNG